METKITPGRFVLWSLGIAFYLILAREQREGNGACFFSFSKRMKSNQNNN